MFGDFLRPYVDIGRNTDLQTDPVSNQFSLIRELRVVLGKPLDDGAVVKFVEVRPKLD